MFYFHSSRRSARFIGTEPFVASKTVRGIIWCLRMIRSARTGYLMAAMQLQASSSSIHVLIYLAALTLAWRKRECFALRASSVRFYVSIKTSLQGQKYRILVTRISFNPALSDIPSISLKSPTSLSDLFYASGRKEGIISSMDRITAKTTSKDVQAAAGHDRTHWRRFLVSLIYIALQISDNYTLFHIFVHAALQGSFFVSDE